MAARLVVLTLAALLAGFGVASLRDTRACEEQSTEVIRFSLRATDRLDGDALQRECRGAHVIALSAYALAQRDYLDEAIELADEAIRREPENHEGWAALARTLERRGLDEAAARARREVLRLNPRYGTRG